MTKKEIIKKILEIDKKLLESKKYVEDKKEHIEKQRPNDLAMIGFTTGQKLGIEHAINLIESLMIDMGEF